MQNDQNIETEAKWPLKKTREFGRIRKILKENGGVFIGKNHEVNQLFDNAKCELKNTGKVLRVRHLEDEHKTLLTFKGKSKAEAGIKSRLELEIEVINCDTAKGILKELGFAKTLEYLKERETWHFNGTVIALDKLSFGRYCEIEGPIALIKSTAAILGLSFDTLETRSYPALMEAHS